jgi:hypothetical protein
MFKNLFILSTLFAFANAVCPNNCSGHGSCNAFDVCTCFDEGKTLYFGKDSDPTKGEAYNYDTSNELLSKSWTGADCSLATCPRGMSWKQSVQSFVLTVASGTYTTGQVVRQGNSSATISVVGSSTSLTVEMINGKFELGSADLGTVGTAFAVTAIASKIDNMHVDNVECSDGGLCDRTSGNCVCFPGYEGSACQRTACENNCSGHGICQSNLKFAEDGGARYHKAWDSGNHFGCKCDSGYRGGDCSLIECPSAADPLNWHGNSQGRDCSGRGLCDYTTGVCQCFPGYTQKDCATVEALA